MMNSTTLHQRLEEIAGTPGKDDKQRLVGALLEDDFAREALTMMYDGRITFGVAKKTLDPLDAIPAGAEDFDDFAVCFRVGYLLDRLRNRELTGNAAKAELEHEWRTLDRPSRELLRRILLKDARAGFTEGTINRARPGTVFTFDCMLAHKYEVKRIKDWTRVMAEPKLDGMRALAITDRAAGKAVFYTRSGNEIPNAAHLAPTLLQMIDASGFQGDMVVESELVVAAGGFNDTISAAKGSGGKEGDLVAHVFDILPLEVFKGEAQSGIYLQRRKDLLTVFGGDSARPGFQVVPSYVVVSDADIGGYYERVRARGLEGLIIKPMDGRYENKRSYNWLKIKAEETEDLVVARIFEGEYGTKYAGNMGGVIVARANGVEVSVGSGWSDVERAEFFAHPERLIGRMIEVQYHEETPDGSLRHPRFVRFRDDKANQREAA